MFQNYNQCTFCKSKKILKLNNEKAENNFYVEAFLSDLRINKKKFSKIKVL